MSDLERFINTASLFDADPLIKMALIHHQFESIHPFYDGNGRTGRIINVLYLVKEKLLDIPVLYLSRYIVGNKADYYRLLQEVRERDTWEEWVLYMLTAVEQTAADSITTISAIHQFTNRHVGMVMRLIALWATLFLITAMILLLANLLIRTLGLLQHEQRYVMAGAGVLAIVLNYFVARRLHRRLTEVRLRKL